MHREWYDWLKPIYWRISSLLCILTSPTPFGKVVDSISTPIKSYWLCDIVNEITLRLLALECQGTWWMHHRHQFLLTWRIPKYVNTKPHQWSHQDPWSLTRISYYLTCCRILILGVSMSMCNIGSEEKNAESRTCQYLKVTVLWRSNHLMHFTIFIFSVDFPADEHETRALSIFASTSARSHSWWIILARCWWLTGLRSKSSQSDGIVLSTNLTMY